MSEKESGLSKLIIDQEAIYMIKIHEKIHDLEPALDEFLSRIFADVSTIWRSGVCSFLQAIYNQQSDHKYLSNGSEF